MPSWSGQSVILFFFPYGSKTMVSCVQVQRLLVVDIFRVISISEEIPGSLVRS